MNILKISMKSLQNEEFYNFITEFEAAVDHFDSDVLGITKLYDLFTPLTRKIDQALEVLRKSVHTKEMEEADHKRDELFRGLVEVVKGSLKQPDANKQKAATNLYNVLQLYSKPILRGSLLKESAAIYNLVKDLKGPYATSVTLLGLTEWVTAINNTENEFLAYHDERQKESVAKPKADITLLRSQITRIYTAITQVLDAQLLADGLGGSFEVDPEDLDDDVHTGGESFAPETHGNIVYNFVIDWNETVKKYRNLLSQRAGRRAKSEMPG
jgi:hypothetical protein